MDFGTVDVACKVHNTKEVIGTQNKMYKEKTNPIETAQAKQYC